MLASGRTMDSTPSPLYFWKRRDRGSFRRADGWNRVTDKPFTREERREYAARVVAQWSAWAEAELDSAKPESSP